MTETCSIHLLADAPDCIPTIAEWYKSEWSTWFRDTPVAEIEEDFRAVANRNGLPIALAACDGDDHPLGACSVRADVFEPYAHAGPWLRGLYVHTPFRGQGIAQHLIRAACDHAAQRQVPKLYAATHSAIKSFERAGWLGFDQVSHEGQLLTIFAKRIG
ncbi:MAG: GNAT family N-acetyltransferase [Betaproteobacteria bacterium]